MSLKLISVLFFRTSSKKKTPNSAAKATKKQSQPKIGKTLFTSAKNSSETKTEGNTNEDTEYV